MCEQWNEKVDVHVQCVYLADSIQCIHKRGTKLLVNMKRNQQHDVLANKQARREPQISAARLSQLMSCTYPSTSSSASSGQAAAAAAAARCRCRAPALARRRRTRRNRTGGMRRTPAARPRRRRTPRPRPRPPRRRRLPCASPWPSLLYAGILREGYPIHVSNRVIQTSVLPVTANDLFTFWLCAVFFFFFFCCGRVVAS